MWGVLVDLERKPRRDRWISYFSLILVFFWGPALVSFFAGATIGSVAATMGGAIPAETFVVGTDATWAEVFTHNMWILLGVVLGSLTVGVVTAALVMLNGALLGYGFGYLVGAYGWGVALRSVGAHGVFELPALWLTGMVAFRVVHLLVLMRPTGRKLLDERRLRGVVDTRDVVEITCLFAVAIALLAVAALVEVMVTPEILKSGF